MTVVYYVDVEETILLSLSAHSVSCIINFWGYFFGGLTFSPPTFSPSENSTHTVGPSDNWSAVRLVLVTNSPSPKPKVETVHLP